MAEFGSFDIGSSASSGSRSDGGLNKISIRRGSSRLRGRRRRVSGNFVGWILMFVLAVLFVLVVGTVFLYNGKVDLTPSWKSVALGEGLLVVPYGTDNVDDVVFYDVIKVSNKFKVGDYNVKSVKRVFNRATGVVTLYNEMDVDQKLADNTRLRSEDGKIYYIVDNGVVIPAGSKENPGSVDVKVIAESYGADYNMESGNFVFPGWEESGRMDRFRYQYGVVKEPIVGGEISENIYEIDGNVVITDDMKNEMRNELLNLAKDNIDKLTENLVIPDANSFRISDEFEYDNYDEEQNEVEVYADAEIALLSVKLDDVENYVVGVYKKENGGDNFDYFMYWEEVYDRFFIKDYVGGNDIVDSNGVVLGLADGSVLIYPVVDADLVAVDLVGKKKSEIAHILKKYPISGYNVVIYPPWMRRLPSSVDRIDIRVLYPYEENL